MDNAEVGRACRALGDPTRLRILLFLSSCGDCVAVGGCGEVRSMQGPTVGEVCCHLTGVERATSTISFHLKELREAGLITMEKRGRHLVCTLNRPLMRELGEFLSGVAGAA